MNSRRVLSILLCAGLLASSALFAGGCGFKLPFGLSNSHSSDTSEAVSQGDGLPPGIDDGEADDYLYAEKNEAAATAQTASAEAASDGENTGEADASLSDAAAADVTQAADGESTDMAQEDSNAANKGFFQLNACDSQLGAQPLLDAPDAETVYVTAVGANVRADSSLDSEIIGTVRQGMSLLRYERSGEWSYVRYAGRLGYVWSELLSETRPSAVISSHDQDGDGIDDQTEILLNARAYVATRPIYESRYYDSGYPDDGYGVCSDIITFAMRDAGYDLRELLAADIAANPSAYPDIKEPDSKIDFRRVVNLLTYFERHYIPKTTDLAQLDEWQGGDIIFFDHHIAVVSDRRNAEGIPYIIHHRSKSQIDYEEDYLGIRSDVIGHFRISE